LDHLHRHPIGHSSVSLCFVCFSEHGLDHTQLCTYCGKYSRLVFLNIPSDTVSPRHLDAADADDDGAPSPVRPLTFHRLIFQVTFVAFHWVKGAPFIDAGLEDGKYDKLTLWEQIDYGVQYTSTRKFLWLVPLVL